MLSSNTTITTTNNNNKTIDIKLVNRYSSNKTVRYEMLGNQVRCAVTSYGYYDKKNSYPAVLTFYCGHLIVVKEIHIFLFWI